MDSLDLVVNNLTNDVILHVGNPCSSGYVFVLKVGEEREVGWEGGGGRGGRKGDGRKERKRVGGREGGGGESERGKEITSEGWRRGGGW